MVSVRLTTLFSVSTLGLLLAGCGGGGGSSPTPTNAAPVFGSAATLSIPENTALLYKISAADADGDAVTFAITGGADRNFFQLLPDGSLSWAALDRFRTGVANYDTFEDADHDSVYQVQVTATDARGATSVQGLSVALRNDREGVFVHRVGEGFSHPVALAAIPGSGSAYVAEKTGKIFELNAATGQKTLVLSIADISTDGERGILAMALGPDQGATEFLFVMYTNSQGDIVVQRYPRAALGGAAPITSYQVVSIPRRQYNNGLGGWIAFLNNDIYIGTPDGGGVDDPLATAQDPNSLLGKVLRLTRNPDASSSSLYIGAPSNPYASGGGSPLVLALGLHNPNGGEFATVGSSVLLTADRGSTRADEINSTWGPFNLGWPYFEGTVPVSANPPAGLMDPRVEFRRGNGWQMGQGLVGGTFFNGNIGSLRGRYIFADLGADIWTDVRCGALATLPTFGCGLERRTADFVPDLGQVDRPVDIAAGPDSSSGFFIVDEDGEIFQVTSS